MVRNPPSPRANKHIVAASECQCVSVATSSLQSCSSVTEHWLFTHLMKEGFLSAKEAARRRWRLHTSYCNKYTGYFRSLFVLYCHVIISNHRGEKKPSLSCWVDWTDRIWLNCMEILQMWLTCSLCCSLQGPDCSVRLLLDAMLCCIRFHHECL